MNNRKRVSFLFIAVQIESTAREEYLVYTSSVTPQAPVAVSWPPKLRPCPTCSAFRSKPFVFTDNGILFNPDCCSFCGMFGRVGKYFSLDGSTVFWHQVLRSTRIRFGFQLAPVLSSPGGLQLLCCQKWFCCIVFFLPALGPHLNTAL